MMKTKIFVDSSFWIALVDKSDSCHQKAKEVLEKNSTFHSNLFTSDYVLDECLTRIKKKINNKAAVSFYSLIFNKESKRLLTILTTTKKDFDKAYKIFKTNPLPKTFSFTDASLVALMKTYRIKTLLAFDSDFKKIKPKIQVTP